MRDLRGRAPIPAPYFPPLLSPMTDRVVLGFDYGAGCIGVAIGNSVTRQARALTTLEAAAAAARWQAIEALVAEWQPQHLVVGIPRHPDGAAHQMTARCERFARQLEGRFRLPVARVDERYSSAVSADSIDVDAAAASVILQQWFDEEGSHDA
jgi:putative Holliday junction resolvase